MEQFRAAEESFEVAADTRTDALQKSHAYAWLTRTELVKFTFDANRIH